jgi:GINS complex subunit 4
LNKIAFLKEYGAAMEGHLRRTVLDHIPQDAWRKLDAPEMIDEPDLDSFVFCRCVEDIVMNAGTEEQPNINQHAAGACLIIRYRRIRDFVLEGKVALLA